MLMGKLSPGGVLTDIQNVDAARTWSDGSTDVPVVAQPNFPPPYGYDSANQVATSNLVALTAAQRSQAVSLATDPGASSKLQRAVLIAILNNAVAALNTLREWDMQFQAAVAASTSLADLKARVAALPLLSDIVVANAIAAVKTDVVNQINAGNAD